MVLLIDEKPLCIKHYVEREDEARLEKFLEHRLPGTNGSTFDRTIVDEVKQQRLQLFSRYQAYFDARVSLWEKQATKHHDNAHFLIKDRRKYSSLVDYLRNIPQDTKKDGDSEKHTSICEKIVKDPSRIGLESPIEFFRERKLINEDGDIIACPDIIAFDGTRFYLIEVKHVGDSPGKSLKKSFKAFMYSFGVYPIMIGVHYRENGRFEHNTLPPPGKLGVFCQRFLGMKHFHEDLVPEVSWPRYFGGRFPLI